MTKEHINDENSHCSLIHSDDRLQITSTPSQITADHDEHLANGMYRFDQSTNQWLLCSHVSLAMDDAKHSFTTEMCVPEQCQLLTWNISVSGNRTEDISSNDRYYAVLQTLESCLPDIVCLQQTSEYFLDLLLDERWLKENGYTFILNRNESHSFGQMILMKNKIQPRAFSMGPLNLSEAESSDLRTVECMIARFALNSNVTIDLVNLDLSGYSHERRSQVLEGLFQRMNTQNYMLIGDFTFGDYDVDEHSLFGKYKHQIRDLWKDLHDLDESPGYTFLATRDDDTSTPSNRSVGCRADRYLIHRLHNLSYSVEHLNIINGPHTNRFDHRPLQLIVKFRVRSISHRSALAILPFDNACHLSADPSVDQWPPCIELFCPFFYLYYTEDDEEDILLPLRLLSAQYQPFDIEIDSQTRSWKLSSKSIKNIRQFSEQMQQLFPQCLWANNSYLKSTQLDACDNLQIVQTPSASSETIRYLYILQQSSDHGSTSFHRSYQIPLGSVLEPIGFNHSSSIGADLGAFFHRMKLYRSDQSFEQKQDKFHRLDTCLQRIFNEKTLHYFTYAFYPYGSFRLGLDGEDLDTVFVLSEEQCAETKTDLDRAFLPLRYDPSAFSNSILHLLQTQLMNDSSMEIIECRIIQAIYPIISIVFKDLIRVEIFVQIKEKSLVNEHDLHSLHHLYEPIHGVHDVERLIVHVRSSPIFQHLLTYIRSWAHNAGLYGQVYGYLGGYSWAILCAHICHRFLPLLDSPFTIEQFFTLVRNFFSIHSQFSWSDASLCLTSHADQSSIENRGAMRILCPNPPYNNSARSTVKSTRELIVDGLKNARNIIERAVNYEGCLEEILHCSDQFPDRRIQSILQLNLSTQTNAELSQWLGYMKSRLGHFLTDCEVECQLFVQPDTRLRMRQDTLQRFYSIGFQLDEHLLSHHRPFYHSLNRFVDQFRICPFRCATMKISYKLMSKHHWDIEWKQT